MTRFLFIFFGLILLSATSFADLPGGHKKVSFADHLDGCNHGCTAEFGKVIGRTRFEIPVFSNCTRQCVSREKAYAYPMGNWPPIHGYKYNSLEFVNRWLLEILGVKIECKSSRDCFHGDHWENIEYIFSMQEREPKSHKLSFFTNGKSKSKPLPGDLLYSFPKQAPVGTVEFEQEVGFISIIDSVRYRKPTQPLDPHSNRRVVVGTAYVVEQNVTNTPWEADYARKIDILRDNDGFYSLGSEDEKFMVWEWKRIPEQVFPKDFYRTRTIK